MAITVFELLKQYIDKKKLGSDVYIVRWSKLLWIDVLQQNKRKWHKPLLHSTHATYFYIYEARKASVTPCPNLVTKSQKYAKVLLEFSDKILTRKHEKDLASEIVEIR